MKPVLLAVSAIILMAAPGYSQSKSEKAGSNSRVNSSSTTEDFVTLSASSDMFEVEWSKLAVDNATDPETWSFAEQMITDRQRTSEQLESLLATKVNSTKAPAGLLKISRKCSTSSKDCNAMTSQNNTAVSRKMCMKMLSTFLSGMERGRERCPQGCGFLLPDRDDFRCFELRGSRTFTAGEIDRVPPATGNIRGASRFLWRQSG